MEYRTLEQIGEKLRSLGHERREVVHEIVADARQGDATEARYLYRKLDRISEECIALMQRQRELIAHELSDGNLG
ncbi:MAG: hypothetical protein ACOY93_17010 [Bacillota bacterium]